MFPAVGQEFDSYPPEQYRYVFYFPRDLGVLDKLCLLLALGCRMRVGRFKLRAWLRHSLYMSSCGSGRAARTGGTGQLLE